MMNGLFGSSIDDPKTMGVMQLAAGLMGSPRFGQGLSNGLLGYAETVQRAKQQAAQEQLRAMQIEQMKLQMEQSRQQQEQQTRDRTLMQGMFQPMPGPTQDQGPLMPNFDPRQMLGQGGSPEAAMQALNLHTAMKKPAVAPIKLGKDETLLDPTTFKPLASAPKTPEKPTNDIQEYQFAVSQGYKGTFNQYLTELKKAGASKVNVPVSLNTAKAFSETLAEKMAAAAETSHGQARSAVGSIDTAQRLKQAVDSGKLISGPGATARVFGLQLGQMLGVGGKDGAETLANTRTAIQSMAQAELDAAMQMKGQGQITEAERDIIRRAASGNIDSLTAPEIRLLADSLEKVARNKIKAHKSNVERLRGIEGTAPLVPSLEMEEPAPYQSPASAPGGQRVRRYNPQTGRIE
jgi:hypothetical protein